MIFDLVLPLAVLLTLVSGYNYCNNSSHVCNLGGLQHFMCRLDEELPPYSGTIFEETIPVTKYFQTEVLISLNNFRDMLSSGQVMNKMNMTFPSAKRMRRLIWDNELGYLARVHASRVSFKHTECRSTLRFPFVGEIIAVIAARMEPPKLKVVDVLTNAFAPIWSTHDEVKDPEKFVAGFDPETDSSAGDFAIIASDRISRVGCSISVGSSCPYRESNGFCHFLTCYFDNNNMVNTSVYKTGVPTSGCDEWDTIASNKWSYLCKNLGVIFPNT